MSHPRSFVWVTSRYEVFFEELIRFSCSRYFVVFLKSESSEPYSEKCATGPGPESTESIPQGHNVASSRSTLQQFFHLRSCPARRPFIWGFLTNAFYAFTVSPTHITFPSYLTGFYTTAIRIKYDVYKLYSSWFVILSVPFLRHLS